MEKIKLPEDGSVEAAIKQLKGDAKDQDERYLILGYSDKNTLCVVDSGVGGFEQCLPHFVADQCRYALIRKILKVEMANTIKFAYIDWTPETLPPMRKALLSTHKGQVEQLLKPYHVSLQASSNGDLANGANIISDKMGNAAGTASHVVAHGADKKVDTPQVKKNLVPTAVTQDVKLNIENEDELKAALADVRNDNSDINWALVGYKDVSTLIFLAKGNGGVEELAQRLTADQYYYALFRTTETYDKSTRVMFGFLKLLSDAVPSIQRAKMSTHQGFITSLFHPAHVEFSLDSPADFTPELVRNKLQDNMGTKSRVREVTKPAETKSASAHAHAGPSVPKQAHQAIEFTDDGEFKNAIAAVRSDANDVTWAAVSLASKNTLDVKATGQGGVADLAAAFEDGKVNFGLLRVIDKIDNSQTVKFAFITYQPDSIPPVQKAQLTTLTGAITDLFRPFHVQFFITNTNELSDQQVADAVGSASGSRSAVLPTPPAETPQD